MISDNCVNRQERELYDDIDLQYFDDMDFWETDWICIQGCLGCDKNTVYIPVSSGCIDCPGNWRTDLYSTSVASDYWSCGDDICVKIKDNISQNSWNFPKISSYSAILWEYPVSCFQVSVHEKHALEFFLD